MSSSRKGENNITCKKVPTKRIVDDARKRIPVGQICGRLAKHIKGEADMSTTQLRAAEILLRKAMPDLSQVEHTGEIQTSLGDLLALAEEKRLETAKGVINQTDSDNESATRH